MARCYARTTKRRSLRFWPPGAESVYSEERAGGSLAAKLMDPLGPVRMRTQG